MGLFSFLNRNNDPLASLRQISLALNGKEYDESTTTNTLQGQKITADPEGNMTDDFSKKTVKPVIERKKILPLVAEECRDALRLPIQSLHNYLLASQDKYLASDLEYLANATNKLVRDLDKYQSTLNPDDLIPAIKAKKDFQNACKIFNIQDKAILGLIAAILIATVALLAAPLIPAVALSVKVGLTTTAALAGALGTFQLAKSISPLEQYNGVEKAINPLLGCSTPTSNPYSQSRLNFSDKLSFDHKEMTGPKEENDEQSKKPGFLFSCCYR